MISQSQLQEMRSVDITQADRSTLVDIRNIHIDVALPAAQKMQNYLEQVGNPYCFHSACTLTGKTATLPKRNTAA